MFKGKTPGKLIIPSPNQDIDIIRNEYGTSTAKRRKIAFITQTKKLSNEEQITESHNQLINYIDNLEQKVQKIIESHDSQFLLAYKNHLNRVRQQMQQLKNKNAKQANTASNQTQKIETLEKELIIFREQSLKLFDKMTEKEKQIQLLKMKIYQLQTEHKFDKKTITDLMRKNKYLEALVKEFDLNKTGFTRQDQDSFDKTNTHPIIKVKSLRKYFSQQKKTTKMIGIDTSFNQTSKKIQSVNGTEKDTRPMTTALGSKRNSISMYSQSNAKSINQYFIRNLASNLRRV